MLIIYILILLASFYMLAVVCDKYFVESLQDISKRLNLAPEAAGATLMAVGSSAPELFVSLLALLKPGQEAMGAGTIVGSAIFNILVITGASVIARKAQLVWQPVMRDMLFYSFSIILLLLAFQDGKITLWESLAFLATYALYIVAVVNWKKLFKYQDDDPIEIVEEALEEKSWKKFFAPVDWIIDSTFSFTKSHSAIFTISIIWIVALSWVLVESAVLSANILNIPSVIIGLTVLAAGTSMPDLLSSIIVARKGHTGMAISNGVGSNIFDILFCLGFPWLLAMIFMNKTVTVATENLTSSVILLFATVVTMMTLFIVRNWKIGKYSGYFLIALYILYALWISLQAL